VEDRPGALARVAEELAERSISVARLLQHQNGNGAALHVITHEARAGALDDALDAIAELPDVHKRPQPLPVISERGVVELGWA
jgi:ACT domain-containing protein